TSTAWTEVALAGRKTFRCPVSGFAFVPAFKAVRLRARFLFAYPETQDGAVSLATKIGYKHARSIGTKGGCLVIAAGLQPATSPLCRRLPPYDDGVRGALASELSDVVGAPSSDLATVVAWKQSFNARVVKATSTPS